MIEKQYIDIFNQFRKTIDGKSAAVLNSLRDEAFSAFCEKGFPTNKEEDYKYTNVAAEFLPDFALNINRVPLKGNPYFAFRCEVPNLSTNLYYMLNDMFSNDFLPKMEYPDGVYVGSLKEFAEKYPDICAKYYGKIANVKSNGIVAFNTMFTQDGFVVYVPENVIVEKAVQLMNILKSNMDALVSRRILLIAEDNAQIKLLLCDHAMDESQYLVTQVVEVYAGKNAVVDFYELEENSNNVTRLSTVYIQQESSSNVLINNLTLNCGVSRNNYHLKLIGEFAEAYVCGMVVADQQQLVDNFVFVDHLKPQCHSKQLFKYVLQEEATGSFCGRIRVEKDAQKTVAYQTNNNLCTSEKAHMYSKPQLEIYADDVKCSHGLTTGQLDEEALFYMQARGISKEEARLMLIQAFTTEVLDHIRIEELKLRLQELVEKRFRGEKARCGNCDVCK